MLKNKTIFILSLMRFDGLQSTNFTIAKYLARENDVYYIEHPYSIVDYLRLNKKENEYISRKKGFSFFSNGLLEQKIDGVNMLISRITLPTNFLKPGKIYDTFLNLNESIIASRIKAIVKQKKISEYIYINAYDFFFPALGNKLNAKLNIYYCVDPIPDYHKKHGIKNEAKLIKNSDAIICTSKALYREKKKINNNCYFVPNGADLVEKVNLSELKPHPALSEIPKPIVGYIGAIERRFDYKLMQEVIATNPDKSFVFVGPLDKSALPEWFLKQKNVYFLSPIPYEDVPHMIWGFDVCIIPFKKDEISDCIFPLKLFEYLGFGKPVVVTDFNEDLKDFTNNLVEFADSSVSFSKSIEKSLQENNSELESARIQLAKMNTWQNRADMIGTIIQKNLNDH